MKWLTFNLNILVFCWVLMCFGCKTSLDSSEENQDTGGASPKTSLTGKVLGAGGASSGAVTPEPADKPECRPGKALVPVFVNVPELPPITIEVDPNTADAAALMCLVSARLPSMGIRSQWLDENGFHPYLASKKLKPGVPLAKYGVGKDTTLHLIASFLRGGIHNGANIDYRDWVDKFNYVALLTVTRVGETPEHHENRNCTGTRLSGEWDGYVLTAAHCFFHKPDAPFTVRCNEGHDDHPIRVGEICRPVPQSRVDIFVASDQANGEDIKAARLNTLDRSPPLRPWKNRFYWHSLGDSVAYQAPSVQAESILIHPAFNWAQEGGIDKYGKGVHDLALVKLAAFRPGEEDMSAEKRCDVQIGSSLFAKQRKHFRQQFEPLLTDQGRGTIRALTMGFGSSAYGTGPVPLQGYGSQTDPERKKQILDSWKEKNRHHRSRITGAWGALEITPETMESHPMTASLSADLLVYGRLWLSGVEGEEATIWQQRTEGDSGGGLMIPMNSDTVEREDLPPPPAGRYRVEKLLAFSRKDHFRTFDGPQPMGAEGLTKMEKVFLDVAEIGYQSKIKNDRQAAAGRGGGSLGGAAAAEAAGAAPDVCRVALVGVASREHRFDGFFYTGTLSPEFGVWLEEAKLLFAAGRIPEGVPGAGGSATKRKVGETREEDPSLGKKRR